MANELKPVNCGCGGSPVFMTRGSATYLKCMGCGMESPKLSKAEAVKAWNKAMGADMNSVVSVFSSEVKDESDL